MALIACVLCTLSCQSDPQKKPERSRIRDSPFLDYSRQDPQTPSAEVGEDLLGIAALRDPLVSRPSGSGEPDDAEESLCPSGHGQGYLDGGGGQGREILGLLP